MHDPDGKTSASNEVWQVPIQISKPLVQTNVVQKLFQEKNHTTTMNNCMILNCLSRCQIASIAAVFPNLVRRSQPIPGQGYRICQGTGA